MLGVLARVVSCDPGFNELTDQGVALSVRKNPLPSRAIDYLSRLGPKFYRLHPVVNHALTTGSSDPLRLSDCASMAEWRRSPLYNECFRGVGCDYQMGFLWGAGPVWFGLPMNRAGRDFSDEEKQLVCLLRPHVVQAHANVQAFARLSQAIETLQGSVILAARDGRIQYATPKALTWLVEYFHLSRESTILPQPLVDWLRQAHGFSQPFPFVQPNDGNRLVIRAVPSSVEPVTLLVEERRAASPVQLRQLGISGREADVLFWISKGKTNPEIALIIGIATNTVRNHVEHLLKKLRVENRLAAATIALHTLSGSEAAQD